ncbi:alpha/beta hydrolase [Zafaria sp. J156]|uniref:alpha/beta hydrolase n=1 Tax=Zafaria sp. J156 TaxID=3116490 RepID=UPI002E78C37C|nr:alpha/beta hydrolase [Zafaria sp. J156]MEE1621445.1 alpha/beta hydrolase [Zafaria sp. J156]
MVYYPLGVDLSATDELPDAEAVRTAAGTLKDAAQDVYDHVEAAHTTWAGLPGVYDGPGEPALFAAFARPLTDAEDLLGSAETVRTAARALATAITSLKTRRTTLRDTTLPAKEAEVDRATDAADPLHHQLIVALARAELQGIADGIAEDWEAAQDDYDTALDGIARTATDTTAHFDYGTNSAAVSTARELFEAATRPGATGADVSAYYAHLATLTPEQIEALGAAHPETRATAPPLPVTAADLDTFPGGREGAAWWNGLGEEARAALLATLPALVGNTQGVPYATRDAANRTTLALVLDDPSYTAEQRAAYRNIREALLPAGPDSGPRGLLSFSPDGRPLAAVSIGDVDHAGNVTFSVSGMGSGTHNTTGEMDNLQDVYDGLGPGSAAVLWLGYDSPDLPQHLDTAGSPEVLNVAQADVGGTALAHALDGFHETRSAHGDREVPQVNVVAHSYGTTTAAYALTRTEHAVDHFVMYGSAGIDPGAADHASDFNVRDGNVWATLAYKDPWAPIGQVGSFFGDVPRISPTDDAFGARVFSSDGEGNIPGHAGTGHDQVAGSANDDGWGYIEPGSQSYNSIMAILDGRGESIELIGQSRRDTMIEDVTARVRSIEEAYQNVQQGIDDAQLRGNARYDAFQDAVSGYVDRQQDGANAAVDGTQRRVDSAVDRGQDGAGSLIDRLQSGATRHLPGPVSTLVNGGVDAGQSVLDAGIDAGQHVVNRGVDAGQGLVNLAVDGLQGAGHGGLEALQDLGNGGTDALQGGAERVHDGLVEAGKDAVTGTRRVVEHLTRTEGFDVEAAMDRGRKFLDGLNPL